MMASADRVARVAVDFGRVWLAARVRAPKLATQDRRRLGAMLARSTLASLRVHLRVAGRTHVWPGPCLVVANHVSWMDVQVLNAVFAARFVAKLETAAWPIVGTIGRGFDTLFLERGSFRDAARVVAMTARALAAGDTVVVFPEATTTDGTSLRRFHPAFFQAAKDAGVPVQPVALRYARPDGSRSPAATFVGETTFVESLRDILREPVLTAEVTIGSAIVSGSRRDLAAEAQARIARSLGLPPSAVDPPCLPRRLAARVAA